MNSIHFKYVIPQVFASREQQDSEIWQQDVVFEKGRLYLVEADSGKGKSTFCSYIQGYRNDFSGQLLFDDVDVKSLKVSRASSHVHRLTSGLICWVSAISVMPKWGACRSGSSSVWP